MIIDKKHQQIHEMKNFCSISIQLWRFLPLYWCKIFNSLRPRPNRHHFANDISKYIFENENEWISPRISLKFVPKVRINNIPALVQIMAWRRPGDKPLSEPMMASILTHICVTQPQWVKETTHLWKVNIKSKKKAYIYTTQSLNNIVELKHEWFILRTKKWGKQIVETNCWSYHLTTLD